MEYEQLIKATEALTGLKITFIVLGLFAFIVSVCLFIKYKVPNLILEITGKTRQKQIEIMQAERTYKDVPNSNFNFDDYSSKYEESSNSKRQKNGTVSKDEGKKKSRRQTTLSNKKRKTVAINRESAPHINKSSHHTVAIKRNEDVESIKLEILDEMLIINSKEIIE